MPLNRVVALLTPLIALAAGAAATWLAENGLDVSQGALEEIFLGGAIAVLAPALHWLNGWQKFEARESTVQAAADAEDDAAAAGYEDSDPDPDPDFDDDHYGEDDDLEGDLGDEELEPAVAAGGHDG